MTRPSAALLFVVVLLAGCGDGGRPTATSEVGASSNQMSTTSTAVASSVATTSTPAGPTSSAMPTTPATAPATSSPTSDQLVLCADGVGPFSFGTERTVVEPWVTAMLGPGAPASVPGGAVHLGCLEPGTGEPTSTDVRAWPSKGLLLVFSRSTSGAVDACGVEQRLWGWALTAPTGAGWRPATDDGIRIGTTLAEARSLGVETEDTGGWPLSWFLIRSTSTAVQPRLGKVDWDWVSDLQRALNAHGAALAVDGQLGRRTAMAIDEYRAAHGLATGYDAVEALVGSGLDDHPIVTLFGGHWFWEFEPYLCGLLDADC